MKLALSNIAVPDSDKHEIYQRMQALGYRGLEVAPTKLMGASPYENITAARAAALKLNDIYGFEFPSMQSIWYGQSGNIFNEEDAGRLGLYTEKAILFASAIGCKSLVFGCPKNRNIPNGKTEDDSVEFFTYIAKNALRNGSVIALEANVPDYGTNFINTSAEAFEFAKKIPGMKVNYDFGTFIANNESLDVLSDNIDSVSHIHISEPFLAPVEKRSEHKQLAVLLAEKGYSRYVSIEMKETDKDNIIRILEYIAEVFA